MPNEPEPETQNRFVPEHADQAYVVLPDGTKVLVGDYAKRQRPAPPEEPPGR